MAYCEFILGSVSRRLALVAFAGVAVCVACGGSDFESGGAAGDAGASAGGNGGSVNGGTSNGGSSAAGSSATAGTSSGGTGGLAGGTSGSGGAPDCVALKADYAAALEKARGCDNGSMDQCSPSSTLATFGCSCPVLVNSKSEFTKIAKQKYQAVQDAKCPEGPTCNIACIPNTSASCSAQKTAAGTAYECTGTTGGIAN